HEGYGVVARRQAFDFELAVGTAYGVERIFHYVDEHAHPGMLVALYRQQNFFAGEGFLERRSLRGLRFVPLTIVFGRGMNVVGGGIAVNDFYRLADHHAE